MRLDQISITFRLDQIRLDQIQIRLDQIRLDQIDRLNGSMDRQIGRQIDRQMDQIDQIRLGRLIDR